MIPEDDSEYEPYFDDEQDLNSQPASQKSDSADDEADYVAEARTKIKQVKRRLDVENSNVSKSPPLKKGKQQKSSLVATSTKPVKTAPSSSTVNGKSVAHDISSSDSSSTEKMKPDVINPLLLCHQRRNWFLGSLPKLDRRNHLLLHPSLPKRNLLFMLIQHQHHRTLLRRSLIIPLW